MNKIQTKKFIAKLKAHEKALAKERDSIRATILEFEELAENADRALDAINDAASILSELV